MSRWERMPGHNESQLYSYPARRWRKKRRQYLMNDNYLTRRNREIETNEGEVMSTTTENGNRTENGDSFEKYIEDTKDAWLRDFDDGSDLPDAGELDDAESDYDDYDEYPSRKKKKKKDAPKRKRVEYSDAEKPYSCDICGARYKTRPGLSYHYSHSHQNDSSAPSGPNSVGGSSGRGNDEDEITYTPPRQIQHPPPSSSAISSPASIHSQSNSMPLITAQLTGQQPSPHGPLSRPARPSPNDEESEGKL